ncbi:IQ calmodulin-binding motif-containing protein 1-like isoform X2 [Entelurus aequoreus]|uniref:IQ calmodulin-binding motif-containing protein 1-like isoform X2 n=1 Tax=Entelurus aequoreus TaxID=161455 RepID=UPI002B1E2DF9|nr:IQ calmodulin-binding motif-containing protein 1-like isoform X2 [Entelurus aequoreus]
MEPLEETLIQLKRDLEDKQMSQHDTINFLNNTLKQFLNMAAVQKDRGVLSRFKSLLYQSGILDHCISLFTPSLQGNWSAAAMLASLTSSCCVGVEPGELSETFHRLFLPSVMDSLLSLASQLARQTQRMDLLKKVMESIGWILRAHSQLTTQVLSSAYYELIQGCDVTAALLCVQMWIDSCTASSDLLSSLCDNSVQLLLNEAVGQLAITSDAALGGASIRLILHMSNQLQLQTLLLNFKGLDSLLEKDWRGCGFDQEVSQLIALLQPCENTSSEECVRAACIIQATWRAYLTRRRLKTLNRVVTMLQRHFRARKKRQQKQRAAQQWEEECKYQVCMRRQQARTKFHQKQRQLLQLLPPDQVQPYLQECERRAAVLIQSTWRGVMARRRVDLQRRVSKHTQAQQRAARTLQRAVRHYLQERRAAKMLSSIPCWIGQKGLTNSKRSVGISSEQCEHLHVDVQWRLQALLQKTIQKSREEQKIESLLAHTHTQLDLLRDTLPLSDVKVADIQRFLSPSSVVAAKARDAHNARLQADRLPWWRTLEDKNAQGEFMGL